MRMDVLICIIMTSLGDSDIDTESFISEIQSRYVIWDQKSREFSDRNLKKKAWEEICNIFIQEFTEKTVYIHILSFEKTVKEKNEAVVKLQKRWKGIRDAYVKDRNKKNRSGSGASTSKEYVYSPLLSFLNTTTRTRPSKTPPPAISDDDNTINISDDYTTNVTKRKKKCDDAEDKMITKLMQRMDKRMNKDRSSECEPEYNFALSLVEDLKSIHPDFKMDAKKEIMGVLKKYKHMSNSYPPNYPGYLTSPEPSRNNSLLPINSSPSVYDENSNAEDTIYNDLFSE